MHEIEEKTSVENLIYEIRGKQVMLDSDLARLYKCANGTKTINLAAYTFIITFVGVLAGAGFVGQFYFAQKEKLNAYKRELEKNSVTNYANTSKVEILEAKIATLEKALSEKLDQ